MQKLPRLSIVFITLVLLTSCQQTEQSKKTVEAKGSTQKAQTTIHVLTPRTVETSSKKILAAPYLRDVLPETAFIYARIPNTWSLLGEPVGNVLDKALGSKAYTEALSSIREGFDKNIIPEFPEEAKAIIGLFLVHITSPVEAIAISSTDENNLLPNVLLNISVDFKDIESVNQLLKSLAKLSPEIILEKALQADGTGAIKVAKKSVQLKFDVASQRLLVLAGLKLKDTSLIESLKLLKVNTKHKMIPFEKDIDASGQGLFVWADPKKLIELANLVGAQRQIAPLSLLGVHSIKNIAVGMGTSKGINHLKYILDMPKTGFRGFIPTVKQGPDFKLSGKTNFVVTLGLPSRTDFISIESSIAAINSVKMQRYYDVKQGFAERVGIEIEDIFDIFGQDISVASDDSGVYTAIRLKDEAKFNKLLADLIQAFNLKHETRTILGEKYHHLIVPSVNQILISDMSKTQRRKFTKSSVGDRLLNVSTHLYWQQEDGYLLMASVPQTLMDRHYSALTPASDWFKKEQRMNPEGALLMASMRSKGVAAAMYQTKLSILAYLGDMVGRPVDMFALPTAREANLSTDGAFGLKLSSTENRLELEISFENNPAEILLADNPYTAVMIAGILASIAMPAYDDYSLKAIVNTGFSDAIIVKKQLDMFKLDNGHYPTSVEVSAMDQSRWISNNHKISIDVETGNIVVNFKHRKLIKDLILIKPDSGTVWECHSELKRTLLPYRCRY